MTSEERARKWLTDGGYFCEVSVQSDDDDDVASLAAQFDAVRNEVIFMEWKDRQDEWTNEIEAAFPTRSGSHDEYATAMQMVGHRHSKGALVALVNWLLVRLRSPR